MELYVSEIILQHVYCNIWNYNLTFIENISSTGTGAMLFLVNPLGTDMFCKMVKHQYYLLNARLLQLTVILSYLCRIYCQKELTPTALLFMILLFQCCHFKYETLNVVVIYVIDNKYLSLNVHVIKCIIVAVMLLFLLKFKYNPRWINLQKFHSNQVVLWKVHIYRRDTIRN